MKNKIPRSSFLYLNAPSELAIRNAINEIEKAGADKKLTDAICLANEALALVSCYIDNKIKQLTSGEKEENSIYSSELLTDDLIKTAFYLSKVPDYEKQGYCPDCEVPNFIHGTTCGWKNADIFLLPTNKRLRINNVYLNVPAEIAIISAMSEIEKIGSHKVLAKAIYLLNMAYGFISNYIDQTLSEKLITS